MIEGNGRAPWADRRAYDGVAGAGLNPGVTAKSESPLRLIENQDGLAYELATAIEVDLHRINDSIFGPVPDSDAGGLKGAPVAAGWFAACIGRRTSLIEVLQDIRRQVNRLNEQTS